MNKKFLNQLLLILGLFFITNLKFLNSQESVTAPQTCNISTTQATDTDLDEFLAEESDEEEPTLWQAYKKSLYGSKDAKLTLAQRWNLFKIVSREIKDLASLTIDGCYLSLSQEIYNKSFDELNFRQRAWIRAKCAKSLGLEVLWGRGKKPILITAALAIIVAGILIRKRHLKKSR